MAKRLRFVHLCVGLIVASFSLLCIPASAGGLPQNPIRVSVSSATATANGTSKITFSVFVYAYYCSSDGYLHETSTCYDGSTSTDERGQPDQVGIYPSGSGNVLGGVNDEGGGVYSVQADSTGHAQFTLASTVAESKTVQFTDYARTQPYAGATSTTVTFTAPPAAPAPVKTTPKATTVTPTPAATPAPVQPPDAPKTTALTIAGQQIADAGHISLQSSQSLTLKGTTVPNGVVTLFIFSTPRQVTVTADATGNWSYAVSGLEPGSHHVEAQVTDPATKQTSARATLAAFTIKAAPVAVVQKPVAKKASSLGWVIGGVVALLVASGAVVGWWMWRKKKQGAAPSNTLSPTEQTPDDHVDTPQAPQS